MCYLECGWAVPDSQSGCPTGTFCAFNFESTGYCLEGSGNVGGGQLEVCTATVAADGTITSDSCRPNFICVGPTPQDPTGLCLRFCQVSNDPLCSTLGLFECAPLQNDIGICFVITCTPGAQGDAFCATKAANAACVDLGNGSGFCSS